MSADDVLVDVRLRVRGSVYRHLFAEAQRRRLDGAAELVEHMLHGQPLPQTKPATCACGGHAAERREPLERDDIDEYVARVDAGEISVRAAAAEAGVSRAAIYYWRQRAKTEAGVGVVPTLEQ